DRRLLVCPTGSSGTYSMGLFDVSNNSSGVYSMSQVGSNFTPISGTSGTATLGSVTRVVIIDDLTADIYSCTTSLGLAVYRVRLEPEPVVSVSTQVVNNTTSQSKKITWTTKANTSAKSFIIEVSTDNGSTWSNLTNVGNNYVVGPQTYNFIDEDQTRALKDCKYRVMAVYDSFTAEGITHTAEGKESNIGHVQPSKKVSNIALTFVPRKAPSAYNPNEDLACLDGVYTFERPKAIDSDENYFPTNDYGFNVSKYRLWIRNTTSSGYAQNASGESLSDIDMTPDNAVSTYGCTTFNSNTVSVPVKGLKRGDSYNCTVQVFYDYVPTTTHIGTGDEWLRSQSWNYTPNPVNGFKVDNYVKRNAVVREYWQEDNQYHDVTYDIYQVHLWMNEPSIVYADGVQIPASYHKLEVSKDGGTTWESLQDFVPQNSPQSTTYPYPAQANVPAGCFQGNNAFHPSKRTNPDGNFQYLVNVGFYYYVYKGNSVHTNHYSPKSVDSETPENWQYRVTSYYGSTPSVTYSGTAYNPSSYNLNQSTYADATVKPTEVTGVDEIERDGLFQVMVYPNPTQGAMTVQSPEPIQTIRIMTISGALIKTFNGSNGPSQMIDLSDIPVGNYFVIVNNQKPVHVIRK
ncbi:MAG: T9SS type A sorting domain-containing protein, partial [Muribaculaceae bacterium]|nr:T9SS type A sorting domain-containing protein [Muribaculaceae bacterium]